MKFTFFLLFSFWFTHPVYAETNSTSASLIWHSDIQSALTLAKKEHKNVMVLVGEESCRWCVKMKERTLSKSCVVKKLQNYVLVSVKRSDKNAIKHLADFDGIIPSFFFMKSNKEPIDSIIGYFTADDFLRYVDELEEE